jgi:hypothetical protein
VNLSAFIVIAAPSRTPEIIIISNNDKLHQGRRNGVNIANSFGFIL